MELLTLINVYKLERYHYFSCIFAIAQITYKITQRGKLDPELIR